VPVVHREPNGRTVPAAAADLNWVFLRDADRFDDGIELLVSAVETDLDHVRTHTRLGLEASRWDFDGSRDKSLLLRGGELAAAEAWLVGAGSKEPQPTELQREFVLASRQAATRRQRTAVGGVSVALLVAIVLSVVALIQRSNAIHQSNVAYAGKLDAEAQAQYPTDPELSLLLATKAAEVEPSTQSEEALRAALGESHIIRRFSFKQSSAGDVLWSPDRTKLLVTHDGAPSRIYQPGGSTPPVVIPRSALPGESAWDGRGDRVVIAGGHPGVFEARSGRLVTSLAGPSAYAAMSSDGTRVATVDTAGGGHVFDATSGREISHFPQPAGTTVTCFALSPSGQLVAQCELTGTGKARLDVWDATTGRSVHSIASRSLQISSVAFDPGGSRFVFTILRRDASKTRPGTFVHDTTSGRLVVSFPGSSRAAVFSPTGKELAYTTIGDNFGHVYFFENRSSTLLVSQVGAIDAVAFGSSRYVVLGGNDKKAQVFDISVNDGKPIETLAGHTEPVRGVGLGLRDTLVTTAADDGTVRLWEIPSQPIPTKTLAGPHGMTSGVPFTGGGSRIAEIGPGGGGRILTVPDLGIIGRIAAPPGQVFDGSVATRDGRFVATISGPPAGAPSTAEAYDGRTGKLAGRLMTPPTGSIFNASIGYAGTRFVTASTSGESDEWAVPAGSLVRRHPGRGIAEDATYSNDGSMLAVARFPAASKATIAKGAVNKPATIDLYRSGTGTLVRTITTGNVKPQIPTQADYVNLKIVFSPDGHTLAIVGVDQAVELYDTRTGRLIRALALDAYARSVAFSPDGKLLAAGTEAEAYVWTLPSTTPARFGVSDVAGNAGFLFPGTGVFVSFTRDSQILATEGFLAQGYLTFAAFDIAGDRQLFKFYPVGRAAVSPDATRYVVSNGGAVSLYKCALCGGLDELVSVAKRSVTRGFTSEETRVFLGRG
jgi:WD40 repeat protein